MDMHHDAEPTEDEPTAGEAGGGERDSVAIPPREIRDRRRAARFAVELEMRLELVLPEETFTPRRYTARVINMSMSGARLVVPLSPTEYAAVVNSGTFRLVRLVGPLPPVSPKVRLLAMVVGENYNRLADPPVCAMSVRFGELTADDKKVLMDYFRLHDGTTRTGI